MFLSVFQLVKAILAVLHSMVAFNKWGLLDATFDYAVVGGGIAGITIPARLPEHGSRVAVVEAGGIIYQKALIDKTLFDNQSRGVGVRVKQFGGHTLKARKEVIISEND